jgi:hypothetical protein
MRIARPKRPDVAFKRKRSPPPQATKLLRYSMLAGIVFMILLAIVFVPIGLRDQPPREVVNPEKGGKFRLDTSNGTRLYVDTTTVSLPLMVFNATFKVNKTEIAYLDPGLAMGNATLNFTDGNQNGLLDSGDYFTILPPPNKCYRFGVYQVNVRPLALAGWLEWGANCA